jgi:hypothetical protein
VASRLISATQLGALEEIAPGFLHVRHLRSRSFVFRLNQDVLQPNKWHDLIRRKFSDDAIGQEMNEFGIADDTAAQNIVVLHCRVAGRLCFTAQPKLTWSARP